MNRKARRSLEKKLDDLQKRIKAAEARDDHVAALRLDEAHFLLLLDWHADSGPIGRHLGKLDHEASERWSRANARMHIEEAS